MGRIHKDFEDTMSNFRQRFAMIMSDMKFLVDEEKPRAEIEAASRHLERQAGDPIIEENLTEDLDQLNQICTNVPPRNNRQSSLDRNQNRAVR
jgi:hypothetical protein